MSFGTGHHETTSLVMNYILDLKLDDSIILDMGCGTGVLSILSEKKGAKHIDSIDIDQWSYENTKENAFLNNCKEIDPHEGDSKLLINKEYDLIIANINKNVLLQDIPKYVSCLQKKGTLLLSGFYASDIEDIQQLCEAENLEYSSHLEKDNWVAVKFIKQ